MFYNKRNFNVTEELKEPPRYLFRQILATSGASLISLVCGFTYGFSAVLLPQLKEDEHFDYDPLQYDSWIASLAPMSMAIGCIFSGIFMDKFGRRLSHLVLIWPFAIGWLMHALAKEVMMVAAARIVTGLSCGIFRTLGVVYVSEVIDTKYRSPMLFMLSMAVTIGIVLNHCVGGIMHYKFSSLVFGCPLILSFVMFIFLKESPLWLISKGREKEGKESFEWFRCKTGTSEKELNILLDKRKNNPTEFKFKEMYNIILSKSFILPYITGVIIFISYQFCGIQTFTFYTQDLVSLIFKDEIDTFTFMLILDCSRLVTNFTLFLTTATCPRRTVYLVSGFLTNFTLLLLILYLVFRPDCIWFPVAISILYICFGSAIATVSWTFVGELFPTHIRGIGSGACSSMGFFILFISIKVAPGVLANFGEITLYSGYIVISLSCLLILYFILPDTHNKSLDDIENSFKAKK